MIYLPLAVLPGLLLAPLGCWPKREAAIDKVALLWGGKPNSAKARSSEELKFLSSQATLSYRVAVATDAFIAFPCGQRTSFPRRQKNSKLVLVLLNLRSLMRQLHYFYGFAVSL